MTNVDENKLDSFQHKCFRRIFKIHWLVKVGNGEMRRKAKTELVSTQVKKRRWLWVRKRGPTHRPHLSTRGQEKERKTERHVEAQSGERTAGAGFNDYDKII